MGDNLSLKSFSSYTPRKTEWEFVRKVRKQEEITLLIPHCIYLCVTTLNFTYNTYLVLINGGGGNHFNNVDHFSTTNCHWLTPPTLNSHWLSISLLIKCTLNNKYLLNATLGHDYMPKLNRLAIVGVSQYIAKAKMQQNISWMKTICIMYRN